MKDNCRVYVVAFVVIIVCIIVFLEVEDLTCVKFRTVLRMILVLMMFLCMDLSVNKCE